MPSKRSYGLRYTEVLFPSGHPNLLSSGIQRNTGIIISLRWRNERDWRRITRAEERDKIGKTIQTNTNFRLLTLHKKCCVRKTRQENLRQGTPTIYTLSAPKKMQGHKLLYSSWFRDATPPMEPANRTCFVMQGANMKCFGKFMNYLVVLLWRIKHGSAPPIHQEPGDQIRAAFREEECSLHLGNRLNGKMRSTKCCSVLCTALIPFLEMLVEV